MLDILRRPDVMARLAAVDAGTALGDYTRPGVGKSPLAVIYVDGAELTDYARGGSAAEAVWITAQQHGLAVQPVSPVFLYAHGPRRPPQLSPAFAAIWAGCNAIPAGLVERQGQASAGIGIQVSAALHDRRCIAAGADYTQIRQIGLTPTRSDPACRSLDQVVTASQPS